MTKVIEEGGWLVLEVRCNDGGIKLRRGRLVFEVSKVSVEGVGFDVPPRFAILLLHGNREAWELFEEVARAPLIAEEKRELLKQGLEVAKERLRTYLANAPNGKPRFYRSYDLGNHVDLTDGKYCVTFMVEDDAKELVKALPPNVYCKSYSILPAITKEALTMSQGELEEFFEFSKRLSYVKDYVRTSTVANLLALFLKNKEEARKLLEKAAREGALRREREEVYNRLFNEGVLYCDSGLIIRAGFKDFYVTNDGNVYKFDYEVSAEKREAILKLYKKGAIPRRLKEVTDPSELREVARELAKVRPELVPIVLP